MLVLQRVCIQRGQEILVQHATLRVENPGLLFLVGTGGAGKSSLLATLAGSAARLGLNHTGTMELDGIRLCAGVTQSTWVAQHVQLEPSENCGEALSARLGTSADSVPHWLDAQGLADLVPMLGGPASGLSRSQRRLLAVLAALDRPSPLYLVDEPTSDMNPEHVAQVRGRLREISRSASTVVATHNRQDCLALGGHTALLAGGAIQECAPSERFFSEPATAAGRVYVETGNCNIPREPRMGRAPGGIWWVVPGLLCGMSRPGLMANTGLQLRNLQESGVRHLVCLEERCHYPLAPIRAAGLNHLHFPVADMAPPSFNQAVDLCRAIESPIRANEGVAMHCRGGLGRTGTALAAFLIWFGDSAEAAIGKVRRAHPLAIQSVAQSRFLHEFADRIRGWHVRETTNKELSNVIG